MYLSKLTRQVVFSIRYDLYMAYIPGRTTSDKVLCDKTFANAINLKYDRFQFGLASMVLKFFDKKSRETTTHTGTRIISEDQQLANELDTPIIVIFKKHKSSCQDHNWGVDMVEIQLIGKYKKGVKFLLCVIDICNQFACVVRLKNKKQLLQSTMHFQKFWKSLVVNQTRYG